MKPFNLERALSGDKLITRNGLEVTEFHYLKSVDITKHKDRDCIVFVAGGELHTVTIDGKSVDDRYDHPLDLFMASTKKTYPVLIFKDKYTGKLCTIEQQLNENENCLVYEHLDYAYFLGIFPIEIEE